MQWLAFVNSTSWSPLQGQSTLLDDWAATTQGVSTNDSQLVVTIPDSNATQVVQVVYNKLVLPSAASLLRPAVQADDLYFVAAVALMTATTHCELATLLDFLQLPE